MQMLVVFLGTGGSMPTKERALPSIGIRFAGELIIFDCGESTQRQLLSSGLGLPKDINLFITHLHADHFLGIPGLLFTLGMLGRESPLTIHGPQGLKEVVGMLLEACRVELPFEVYVNEISGGLVYRGRGFVVEAMAVDHSVEAYAYRLKENDRPGKMNVEYLESIGLERGPKWGLLQRGIPIEHKGQIIDPKDAVGPSRPGRAVVYTGDTRPTENVVNFSRNADILIHDATFRSDLADKAAEDGHSTARQAAEIALKANVRDLYLFHISPRYQDDVDTLLWEARQVFQRSHLPRDLERVEVTYRD
jgi:ribonuclease Z